MSEEPMRGVFPILVTPFDERERIDEESLRSVVEFNLGAGVHGLGIAFGSEIAKLTEAERARVAEVVIGREVIMERKRPILLFDKKKAESA
jgi:4-hydroxy-tetrahydrodipicolinate synthase